MKQSTPWLARYAIIFSVLCSFVAMVMALVEIKVFDLEPSFDNLINFLGIILALIAATATVYSIGTSLDIREYRKKFEGLEREMKDAKDTTLAQHEGTLDAMSALMAVAIKEGKGDVVGLAIGRFICRSQYSSVEQLEEGIRYLLLYSKDNEDVDLLMNRIVHNKDLSGKLEKESYNKLKGQALKAMKEIQNKVKEKCR